MALTENEIRPDDLMAGQAERFANDVRRLNERKGEFVVAPCPACGGEEFEPRFGKYGMSYVDCTRCGTLYVSPRPPPSVLDWYYANSENYAYWNQYIFPASENARREKIFRPRAKRLAEACRKYDVGRGMLIEVGAGFGTFADCVRDLQIFDRLVLVEPTPGLAATCRAKGFEVVEKPVEHIDLSKYQADVVASFEVIEHLFSPLEYLRACYSVLRPGGIVMLSCPNSRGFDIEVLQENASAVDVEHLNYFHPASLSHLAQRCGFDVLETSTPGELDAEIVRKRVLSGDFSLAGDRFLQRVLIDEWDRLGAAFQRFLAENQFSGHLTLIGRKPVST
ncbi:methyltransferase domain-containing protein [Hyphomicrobium sp. xq]|uniref:Methyltransferase domain-containing protein n=1 Tax=Hyphomicrobium album TaxID=2665159 RepID=A0A6I3KJY6_9HYPH|nr:class I SAM-dependent methyltransferase [Hyphomicrobium album]MTD94678.1 methyltransferase domain-containing protein [Hyphomicrobium album]